MVVGRTINVGLSETPRKSHPSGLYSGFCFALCLLNPSETQHLNARPKHRCVVLTILTYTLAE